MQESSRALNQETAAGLIFICAGVAAIYLGKDYDMGTALRMGPGYFPRLLAWLLTAIGILVVAKGILSGGLSLERWHLRPLLLLLAATAAFSMLLDKAGLLTAAIVSTILAVLGARELPLKEAVLLVICIPVVMSAIFVWGLGLSMRVLP